MEDEIKQTEIPKDKPEFEKKLEEMKAENDRMEKNIAEIKELKAFDALSGKTETGQVKEKPKEESPSEYSERILSGKLEVK
jgi:hypothetical protein